MLAGLRVMHPVSTIEGPYVMVKGQNLNGHCLIPQKDRVRLAVGATQISQWN